VDAEVKILSALKAVYKSSTGKDWKPPAEGDKKPQDKVTPNVTDLDNRIVAQGSKIRELKTSKAAKVSVN